MPGPHRHCPCNGVYLCATCHRWAHKHPVEAQAEGLIVPRHSEPMRHSVVAWFGTIWLRCDGGYEEVSSGK